MINRALYNLHVGTELITKILRVELIMDLRLMIWVINWVIRPESIASVVCLSVQNYNMAAELIDAKCDIKQANLNEHAINGI